MSSYLLILVFLILFFLDDVVNYIHVVKLRREQKSKYQSIIKELK